MKLLRSISKKDVKPYTFVDSMHSVYSYEGFIYYCISHVREGMKALGTEEFINWLLYDLELTEIANSLRSIGSTDAKANEVFLEFMSHQVFLGEEVLQKLKDELEDWEEVPLHIELKKLGDDAFARGKYMLAIKYYKRAEKITEQIEVRGNMAAAYMKLHFYSSAESIFSEIIGICQHPEIHINYVKLLKIKGLYEEALKHLQGCAEQQGDARIYHEMGKIFTLLGRHEEAFDAYMKAYEKDGSEESWFKVLEASIESQGAQSVLLHLEQQRPEKNDSYYLLKAKIYIKDGQIDQAIEILEERVSGGSAGKSLVLFLIQLYRRNKQIIKAIHTITEGIKVHEPDDELLFEMALIAKTAGNQTDFYNKTDEILKLWKRNLRDSLTD